MSGAYGWQRMVGQTVAPGYRLQGLLRSELRLATYSGVIENPHNAECLITLVRCATDECDVYLNRFMEARFLRHSNLMAVLDAGKAHLSDVDVAYIVTEPARFPLHTAERLDREVLWQCCGDLLTGLAFLHSENLVYCALREETTWRLEDRWKLGDFHQLRLAGAARVRETRALMGRMPEIPPEAFEGLVSPAWDVWSFGVTLAKVLRHGSGDRRPVTLPEPFETIVNRCLDPNPATRVTIDELARTFAGPYPWASDVARPVVPSVKTPEALKESQVPPEPVLSHQARATRPRWLPFAAAGVVAGIGLTLFAIRQETTSQAGGPAPIVRSAQPLPTDHRKPDPADPVGAQEADRVQTPAPQARIRTLLDTWVESIRNRDLDVQLRCYAPSVDTFYGRQNLSNSDLKREKSRQFSSIGRIRNFSISDIRIRQISPQMAMVAFKKDWDFGSFAGSEHDEWIVRPVNGEWKISSERGRKLYWVRRQKRAFEPTPG